MIRSAKIINGGYIAQVRGAGVLARVAVFDRSSVVVRYVGTPGPSGASAASYTHTQSVAASTWIINHNLGYEPTVQLRSSGGAVIGGDVEHPSINQARAVFAGAIAGKARCN